MKRFGAMMVGATSLAAVLLLAPLSAQAQDGAAPGGGQGRGQGRGGFGGGQFGRGMMGPASLATLPMPVLEKSLSLTADQKTKIEEIQTKAREEMMKNRPDFSGGPPNREEMQAFMQKMQDAQKKTSESIQGTLTDEQKAKVPDLLKDATLFQSAQLPLELISDLKLTPEQKTKIGDATKKIQADSQQKMADARANQDFQAIRGIMQESQAATKTAVQGVLTADQKALVEKWEKEHPRRGFGAGGFGGGGGRRNGNGAPPQQQ